MHSTNSAKRPTAALSLGLALGAALGFAAVSVSAAEAPGATGEKCYGVATKGKNDCAATTSSVPGRTRLCRRSRFPLRMSI